MLHDIPGFGVGQGIKLEPAQGELLHQILRKRLHDDVDERGRTRRCTDIVGHVEGGIGPFLEAEVEGGAAVEQAQGRGVALHQVGATVVEVGEVALGDQPHPFADDAVIFGGAVAQGAALFEAQFQQIPVLGKRIGFPTAAGCAVAVGRPTQAGDGHHGLLILTGGRKINGDAAGVGCGVACRAQGHRAEAVFTGKEQHGRCGAGRAVVQEVGFQQIRHEGAHHQPHIHVGAQLVAQLFHTEGGGGNAPTIDVADSGVGCLVPGGVDIRQCVVALTVAGAAIGGVDAHTVHTGDELFVESFGQVPEVVVGFQVGVAGRVLEDDVHVIIVLLAHGHARQHPLAIVDVDQSQLVDVFTAAPES